MYINWPYTALPAGRCPGCGRCQTCGHGGSPAPQPTFIPAPFWVEPFVRPNVTWTVTSGDTINPNAVPGANAGSLTVRGNFSEQTFGVSS